MGKPAAIYVLGRIMTAGAEVMVVRDSRSASQAGLAQNPAASAVRGETCGLRRISLEDS
jgi:hypothetical protein